MMKSASIVVLMLFSILDSSSPVEGSKLVQQLTSGTFRLGKFHTPNNVRKAVTGVDRIYFYNWKFEDPQIAVLDAKFPSTCQVLCEAEQKCRYWTWFGGKCAMKETGKEMTLSKIGYVSGEKRAHMPHHCFHRGVGFLPDARSKVGDVRTLTEAGDKSLVRQCKEACDNNAKCHFFMQKGQNCTFYNRSAMRDLTEDADAVIGPKECKDGWCYATDMSFGDTSNGFIQFEVGKYTSKVITAQLCQSRCVSFSGCIFWYHKRPGFCHLFKAGASKNHSKAIKGGITGMKTCGTFGPACFAENTQVSGKLIKQVDAESVGMCQRLCYLNNECYFFVFHAAPKKCELHDSTANGTGKQVEGVTSGPYKCYHDI